MVDLGDCAQILPLLAAVCSLRCLNGLTAMQASCGQRSCAISLSGHIDLDYKSHRVGLNGELFEPHMKALDVRTSPSPDAARIHNASYGFEIGKLPRSDKAPQLAARYSLDPIVSNNARHFRLSF